jgi:hypothetical protein
MAKALFDWGADSHRYSKKLNYSKLLQFAKLQGGKKANRLYISVSLTRAFIYRKPGIGSLKMSLLG